MAATPDPKCCHVSRSSFRGMKHTITGRTEKTLMKLIVDADTDKILGIHMVSLPPFLPSSLPLSFPPALVGADTDKIPGMHYKGRVVHACACFACSRHQGACLACVHYTTLVRVLCLLPTLWR